MFKNRIYLFVALAIVLLAGLYYMSTKRSQPIRTLPYFEPKNYTNSKSKEHHTVKDFSFTDQFNEKVTQETVKEKVYVTDFFFTTCQSICPIMSNQLERVYKAFKNRNDFL